MDYKYFAAGYWVKDARALLVYKHKVGKWIPPGGHIKAGETPEETLKREFFEETGTAVEILSASEHKIFGGDDNTIPLPQPFYMDVEKEGFSSPHRGYRIGFFYFVKPAVSDFKLKHQESELSGIEWFGEDELAKIKTFEQVKAVARYAIHHYPKIP